MSQTSADPIRLADGSSNPAPLGLLGFGLTTILLNLHNVGLYGLSSSILGMGLFVGGIAQILAGVMEWKKGNTFGTVAFTAYGSFWITLVAIWTLPKLGLAEASNEVAMGWFLLVWGVFSAFMFVGTLRLNKALQWVFGTLVGLFLLLAIRDFLLAAGIPAGKAVGVAAGWVGILCGSLAFYTSMAHILNEIYGKALLPVGPVKKA